MTDRAPPDRKKTRSGSEKRARPATVKFRATAAEKAAVEAEAERAGVTPADYARAKVLGGAPLRATRRPRVEMQELARCVGLLGKYGSNLNQLNARGHATGRPPPDGVWHQVRAEVMEMRAVLLLALGKRRNADHH